jgi:hypothetical protein
MTAGAPLGSLVAGRLFKSGLAPELILQVSAVLLALSGALYLAVNTRQAAHSAAGHEPLPGRGGFALVLANPYLRLIAALIVLLNVVNTTGEYLVARLLSAEVQQLAALDPLFDKQAYIGAFTGTYQFWVGVTALLLQAFVTSRLVRQRGLTGVLFALPLIALGGYAIVAAGAGFALVRWIKTAENATDYSIMNTARQMLWLPTTREEKYKAKQAIDTFFVRGGDLLSAAVVFGGTPHVCIRQWEQFALCQSRPSRSYGSRWPMRIFGRRAAARGEPALGGWWPRPSRSSCARPIAGSRTDAGQSPNRRARQSTRLDQAVQGTKLAASYQPDSTRAQHSGAPRGIMASRAAGLHFHRQRLLGGGLAEWARATARRSATRAPSTRTAAMVDPQLQDRRSSRSRLPEDGARPPDGGDERPLARRAEGVVLRHRRRHEPRHKQTYEFTTRSVGRAGAGAGVEALRLRRRVRPGLVRGAGAVRRDRGGRSARPTASRGRSRSSTRARRRATPRAAASTASTVGFARDRRRALHVPAHGRRRAALHPDSCAATRRSRCAASCRRRRPRTATRCRSSCCRTWAATSCAAIPRSASATATACCLTGEYRWAAGPFVDMAVFMDAGTVAREFDDLDLGRLTTTQGVG